jgi:nucleotide-binding universal stress UspA family protein
VNRTLLLAAQNDQSDRVALGLVVDLARALESRVVVCGVIVPGGAHDEQARQDLAGALDALQAGIPDGVASETKTVDAVSHVAGVHQLAEDLDAELVVLGAHHRNAVLRALRGDVATELTWHGTWGVAVAHEDRASGPPRRVGVAWDQTPAANAALEWGIQLVERTRGELHILRVFDPRHREGTKPWTHDEVRLASAEEEASLRVNAQAHVLWGDGAPELVTASRDLDLLVMGAGAHGGVRHALFGSVSNRLLHDAKCSVAVLPADAHLEPDE